MLTIPSQRRLIACLSVLWASASFATSAHSQQGSTAYPYSIDEGRLAGAPDRSGLNRPLDRTSRIFVRQGHFFSAGADGIPNTPDDRRTRLYGVSLSFGANFPPGDQAALLARRLRKLGFNAVRLHHLDSLLSDQTDQPYGILTSGPYPSFNTVAIDRLRGLIKALAQEGLYVNLNLRVGYRFRPAVDGLPPLDAGQVSTSLSSPVHAYFPAMADLHETYARQLIRQLNLRGNPALALVEISNESSLLSAWMRRTWSDVQHRNYAPVLEERWRAWLNASYGSVSAACASWSYCAGPEWASALPVPGDRSKEDGVRAEAVRLIERFVQRSAGNRSESGKNNTDTKASHKNRDFLRFLATVDAAYYQRLRQAVHEETDSRVPVTGTQMAFGGVLNFDSHRAMDYLDEHIYVGHPIPGKTDWRDDDWRMANVSATGPEIEHLLALSLRRDASKPFVVSEYNQPFPNPGGAAILPVMAAIGALQDWDGLFFFDYADQWPPPIAPTRFSLAGDWGKLALAGQSAQLFRSNWIPPAAHSLALPLPGSVRLELALSGHADALRRYAERQLGVMPAHAWNYQLAQDLNNSTQSVHWCAPKQPITSGPGLDYDATRQRLIIQTPQAWGIFEPAGSGTVAANGYIANFPGAPKQIAFLMTSLDGRPLRDSNHQLLTLGSATAGTQPGSAPLRPKSVVAYPGKPAWITLEPDAGHAGPSAPRVGHPPTWLLANEVLLDIPNRGEALAVYPLDGAGQRMNALQMTPSSPGTMQVRLQAETAQSSPWFEIVHGKRHPPTARPAQ